MIKNMMTRFWSDEDWHRVKNSDDDKYQFKINVGTGEPHLWTASDVEVMLANVAHHTAWSFVIAILLAAF